jgi:hypothetical protein
LFLAPGRSDRWYFEAFHGRNYSLVIRNNTGARVGVLIAVDGLNVVDGERSRLSRHEAMYVLDPHERAEIRGWRTSLEEVRRFVFVDEERSYAARSGKANSDMGWVRVLAFREAGGYRYSHRIRPWREQRNELGQEDEPSGLEQESAEEPPPAAAAPGDTRSEMKAEGNRRFDWDSHGRERDDSHPGTGWGERSHDVVNRTWFTPESRATDHIVLRYEIRVWSSCARDRRPVASGPAMGAGGRGFRVRAATEVVARPLMRQSPPG